MIKFYPAKHDLLGGISVAVMLAVLSAPALAQTPEADARHKWPDASKLQPHLSPFGTPNAWDLELTRWDRSLSAHLERFKHYPREVKIACGRYDEAGVVFKIDRQGHVLKS